MDFDLAPGMAARQCTLPQVIDQTLTDSARLTANAACQEKSCRFDRRGRYDNRAGFERLLTVRAGVQ